MEIFASYTFHIFLVFNIKIQKAAHKRGITRRDRGGEMDLSVKIDPSLWRGMDIAGRW